MFLLLRVVLLIIFSTITLNAYALTMGPLPQITKDDRILILAPHPDDEAIGTGGVIQEAVNVGAKVKIVLLTNGDNNELSFLVYKKRLVLTRNELLSMGQVRHNETISAAALLGLNEDNIVSLGYPDFGTMDILNRFWGGAKPFRSMLSRVKQVPYSDAMSPGAPYMGESILRDIKAAIFSFKPTKIFVSHPADVNRDHRALYLFLKIALWDIDGRITQPEIFPYLIHVTGWPKPRGYHPELALSVPPDLEHSTIIWHYLALSPNAIELKYNAIKKYVTQNKYAPSYLVTFARQNELFGDYPPVNIFKQMTSEVNWQYIGAGNDSSASSKANINDHISLLSCARQGDILLIRLTLHQEIEKELGITISLFGYNHSIPFYQMPKITLNVSISGLMIKDKNRRISSKEVIYQAEGKVLTFRVPLSMLGNPQRILANAKASVYNLTLDETAWRELDIN